MNSRENYTVVDQEVEPYRECRVKPRKIPNGTVVIMPCIKKIKMHMKYFAYTEYINLYVPYCIYL